MEEAWSRNLQNILMTPVTMTEYYTATMAFGVLKLLFELTLMGAMLALLFQFNILVLGVTLVPFAISLLLTGWAIGLAVNAAIIYFGRGLVALSWIIVFVLQPFCCVFYPVTALPAWAQIKIAYVDPLSGGGATIGEHGLKHLQYLVEVINARPQ
jgi:ABC-2 type transport system permease protein